VSAGIRSACAALPDYPSADLLDGKLRVRAHRNESPLAPPEHVVDALVRIDGDVLRRYPADLQRRVHRGLARRLGVPSRRLATANGADELLLAAARLTLEPGFNAVAARPAFGMYARAVAMAGGELHQVSYDRRWQLDPEQFLACADGQTRLIFVGHPNNPTGDAFGAAELARLARAVPDALVVVDEVYLTMRAESLVAAAGALPNVAVVGSLSKVAALAGLRVGYVTAHPAIARVFRRVLAPYALSSLSLLAAEAYLAGEFATRAFERALAAQTQRSLDAVLEAVAPYATASWRGPANFALIDLGTDARPIVKALRRHGVAVRGFGDPRLRTCIRVCAVGDRETVLLVAALRDVLRRTARESRARA